jgi:hypothetical protein
MREFWSGIVWLGVAVFVCVATFQIGIGSGHAPGPGFFPFWSSAVLGAFSIVHIVSAVLKKGSRVNIADVWRGTHWQKVVFLLVPFFAYPVVMPKLGYILTTLLLILCFMLIIERWRVWWIGVSALAMVAGSYLLFNTCLDVSLPKGVFGF